MPNVLSQMNHTKYQPLYIYPEATIKSDIIENLIIGQKLCVFN